MPNFVKIIIILVSFIFFISCAEKISYSGKILNQKNFSISNIENKKQLLDKFGEPNYIDPIENKYFYYSEQKITKNFFESQISNSQMLVVKFDNLNKILTINEYDLSDRQDFKFVKETTPNTLINRGLIEKLFGGVGKSSLPNTAQ